MNPYRDIWIGTAAATAIMLIGAGLFHNIPAAMQATALVGLVVGIVVRHALDPDAPRRRTGR